MKQTGRVRGRYEEDREGWGEAWKSKGGRRHVEARQACRVKG